MAFIPGQRWISNAEPELGLGTVLRLEGRTVQVLFATAGVLRQYAVQSAPLSRAEFRVGQKVAGQNRSLTIERISEDDGLLVYHAGNQALNEAELDDAQPISQADQRLLSTRTDPPEHFDFRLETLQRRAAARRSPAWGLASARIDLIAHQLRVAAIVSGRRPPRALLADEPGLGKTIEAGMVLARLLASGRAGRVLVLAPGSLVFQWFVELLRRFNLPFALYDEERCQAIELSASGLNPFEDSQCIIADLDWLAGDARRAATLVAAPWDLVVVDEAHHLEWTPEAASPAYRLVEALGARSPGLLLLTATPQQLGRSGHFARLRLLDPARYTDPERHAAEVAGYAGLSALVERLQAGAAATAEDLGHLQRFAEDDPGLAACVQAWQADPASGAAGLLDALIDRHGTGRVMFRNRRDQVGGFPTRLPELVIEDGAQLDEPARQRLLAEFHNDALGQADGRELDYSDDPRLPWLLALIERLGQEKLLLICRSQAKVLALEEALRGRSGARVARFHEGMTLLQRDRSAAWFAEPDGARVLLCSEIGSEGRNFQFAQHLVLWDLPLDPDLLEQRIGRLDRIGQKQDIHIHACAFTGTAQHVLLRWLDEGLDAFRSSPPAGREMLHRYRGRLVAEAERHARAGEAPDVVIDALVSQAAGVHRELAAEVRAGRDRLLELSTARQAGDDVLGAALAAQDHDTAADEFILALFEQFGIAAEETAPRCVVLDPEYLSREGVPGLGEGPQAVTFDRATALAREDLPLLRMDHPMVAGAMDLLLESEHGNAAVLVDASLPARSAVLECVFVLECVADQRLEVERFLPPLPLHVAVDTRLSPRDDYRPHPASLLRARDNPPDAARLRPLLARLVPPMLAACETRARGLAASEIGEALARASSQLDAEHARLAALAEVNPAVRQAELDAITDELEALRHALAGASPRLDSVRLACSPDVASR